MMKEDFFAIFRLAPETEGGKIFYLIFSEPVEYYENYNSDKASILESIDKISSATLPAVFTLSYEAGLKIIGLEQLITKKPASPEPDLFLAFFSKAEILNEESFYTLFGNKENQKGLNKNSAAERESCYPDTANFKAASKITTNLDQKEYSGLILKIKEYILNGETYQTNLTRQIQIDSQADIPTIKIFKTLLERHPADFASFIVRQNSEVVSASPELMLEISGRSIRSCPIKGTAPRGTDKESDLLNRDLLSTSDKDRAENIMIVDLVRNDLGRVCEYGTVKVERLCLIKEYKSHFHMVSEVTGRLRENTRLSDVFSAVFPFGSVTGAPKKRTLEIISELESRQRGLSMGTFGYFLPQNHWKTSIGDKHLNHRLFRGLQQNPILRAAVAIRTMTRFQNQITFNVGGGITIDSDPFNEYKETEIKSLALLDAIEQAFDSEMLVVE